MYEENLPCKTMCRSRSDTHQEAELPLVRMLLQMRSIAGSRHALQETAQEKCALQEDVLLCKTMYEIDLPCKMMVVDRSVLHQ